MINYIVFLFVRTLLTSFCLLPPTLSFKIGQGIGYLIYFADKKHRNIAQENFRLCFKEKTEKEVTRHIQGVFRNLGCLIVEIAMAYRGGKTFVREHVSMEGAEHVEEALKKGNGALIMTGHFGNWELGALGFGMKFPFNFVVRPIDNPYIDQLTLTLRGLFGSGIIAKKNALKEIMRSLKKNETVGILMDQNVLKEEGLFIDFFEREACTTPVVPLVALRTGAPILPAFAVRTAPGKIKIVVQKELSIVKTDDIKKDITTYTQLCNQMIESQIRKYPEQWFWVHNRWKTERED